MKKLLTCSVDLSETKRCYTDIDIKVKCPVCGFMIGNDKDSFYVSYIKEDDDIDIPMFCDNCDEFYSLKAKVKKISISIEFNDNDIKEG